MAQDDDWLSVLDGPCPVCGNDVTTIERNAIGPRMRAVGGQWRMLLGRGDIVKRAPTDGERSWSPLEYGGHVSDVLELFEERIRLTLKKRKPPHFLNWDADEAAAEGDYGEADPDRVAYVLASRAGKVADLVDRVNGDEWDKRSFNSDGVEFTVESIARYLLHDIEHHLWDANEILSQ